MAQRVRYFEDYPTYQEGPFVMVQAQVFVPVLDRGPTPVWRVECELRGGKMSVLPQEDVYALARSRGLSLVGEETAVAQAVDALNELVRQAVIQLHGRVWGVDGATRLTST